MVSKVYLDMLWSPEQSTGTIGCHHCPRYDGAEPLGILSVRRRIWPVHESCDY